MKYFYSPTSRGFYADNFHAPEDIPEDAVEIATELYHDLIAAQGQGKEIYFGGNNLPASRDPAPPTGAEAMANLRATRTRKLAETDGLVQRHRDQLELGTATTLTPEAFTALLHERQALRDLPSTTTDAWADHRELLGW